MRISSIYCRIESFVSSGIWTIQKVILITVHCVDNTIFYQLLIRSNEIGNQLNDIDEKPNFSFELSYL